MTVKLLTGEFKQLTHIDEIRNFWEWLFKNQDRVGKIVKVPISPKIIELMQFEGKIFSQNNKVYKIIKIEAVEGGITVLIQNTENEKEGYLTNQNAQHTLEINQALQALRNYQLI